MRITKRQLRTIIAEALDLDVEVGDIILTGRFKNKRTKVKNIGVDNLGQPTINGMKALSFRIEKLMPKDKWSKKSKEALEFAEKVDEVVYLRRIIREHILVESLSEKEKAQAYTKFEKEKKAPRGRYGVNVTDLHSARQTIDGWVDLLLDELEDEVPQISNIPAEKRNKVIEPVTRGIILSLMSAMAFVAPSARKWDDKR